MAKQQAQGRPQTNTNGCAAGGTAAVPGVASGVAAAERNETTTRVGRVSYVERLTAPVVWWVSGILVLGASGGLILLRSSPTLAAAGAVLGVVVAVVLIAWYGAARIEIDSETLRAGRARVPLAALGAARTLDREEAHRLRTVEADSRAFMLLRSYVGEAVLVPVDDPEDPTPYLYLSTRHPRRLAAALQRTRPR